MTIEEIMSALEALSAETEGRNMTDEEVSRFDELEAELKSAKETEERRSRLDSYKRVNINVPSVSTSNLSGDDEYERAFEHYLRTGKPNADLEYRTQQIGTDSAGGYLVPETFTAKITEKMKAYGGIQAHVTTITTATGEPYHWSTNDDTSASNAAIVAESGTATTGADLVYGAKQLGAYKYMAVGAGSAPLRVSYEMLQDSQVDVQSIIQERLAERIARAQAPHWITGTGTAQPMGIVQGVTPVQIASSGTLTYGDLVTYVHSLDPAYHVNASWAFNFYTLGQIRKLVDTTGQPIWQASPGLTSGMPFGSLLGYPVVIDQGFANANFGTANVTYGVFGDLKKAYIIRRVKDITMVVDPYARKSQGEVEFLAWARADGTQDDTDAYIGLTGK